jgi:HlyD family secretion protein
MKWLTGLLVLCLLAGGGWWLVERQAAGGDAPRLLTATVTRSDLVVTISSTGTLEPEEVIDVGAQVAGRITSLGPEPMDSAKTIDYGSLVDEGTVLALIDEALYKTQVEEAQAQVEQTEAETLQAEAQVEHSQADVKRAEADLAQLKARFTQAERDWKRAQQLRAQKGILSEAEYDLAQALHDTTRASVDVGEATLLQAHATVRDSEAAVVRARATTSNARASLRGAEINLGYCTIRSPVQGVIVDRRVNVGQTVVASLNAPSLFLIAKDLRQMQIWASVNEADIGQIRTGQPVKFTVDAYPDEVFTGEVLQIRLNANMTQNVVTYTVVVAADNAQGRLLPYLTANVKFEVARRANVLAVPNAALRFRPPPELMVSPPAEAAAPSSNAEDKGKKTKAGVVWVAEGTRLKPVDIEVGLTDGTITEVTAGDVKEGDVVVVGLETAAESDTGGASPFTPQIFGGRRATP